MGTTHRYWLLGWQGAGAPEWQRGDPFGAAREASRTEARPGDTVERLARAPQVRVDEEAPQTD